MREWKEEDFACSEWTSEIPLAVASFNYGAFKKKAITDSESGAQIEGYTSLCWSGKNQGEPAP